MSYPTKARHERQDPPEIAALKRVRHDQPQLAAAVDMQIDLLVAQRRIQSRLSTPWLSIDLGVVQARFSQGLPVMRLEDVAFDWTELRVLFRQVADILQRHDCLEPGDHARLLALARAGHPTADEVRGWFDDRSSRITDNTARAASHGESFIQVLELSARPFVERASESIRTRVDLTDWTRPYCPLCGSDPEMASMAPDGSRRLHCGACATAWVFDAETCPHCGNEDRGSQVSYGSPGGYRLTACEACRRYIKVFDPRKADRPFMLAVDTIATLTLDAAAIGRGYAG